MCQCNVKSCTGTGGRYAGVNFKAWGVYVAEIDILYESLIIDLKSMYFKRSINLIYIPPQILSYSSEKTLFEN